MGKIIFMIPVGVGVGLIVHYIVSGITRAAERVFDPDE